MIRLLLLSVLTLSFATMTGACAQPAPPPPPTATPQPPIPTASPLPPELDALASELEGILVDINSILNLYAHEDINRSALDRDLRVLVPTAEALRQSLRDEGVDVPDFPLPPTPAFEPEVESFDIGMVSADGVQLYGTYYNPGVTDAPGVVLLHMVDGNRSDWHTFASQLQANGIAVIAIDLRGHGDSEGERDYTNMVNDAAIAVRFIRAREETDPDRIAIAGASVGANIALNYAREDPDLMGAILFSPGLDYRGVTTENALADYGDRPLLILASEDDTYAVNSSLTLSDQAATAELLLFPGQDHGTTMLENNSDLAGLLVNWLENLFSSSD